MNKLLVLSFIFISTIRAENLQVTSFVKALVIHYEMSQNLENSRSQLASEIQGHVNEYQQLWGIQEEINFKCENGLNSLPNYSSVTPNTELGILISRKCNKLIKLQGSITKVQNNTDVILGVLKKFNVKVEKSDTDDEGLILTKIETMELDGKQVTKETVLKETDVIEGVTETEKQQVEELAKSESVEQQVSPNTDSGCSAYSQTCEGSPKWPGVDTEISGITCNDIRKPEGHKWTSRYNYTCKDNKVILLSDSYQWVKLGACEIGGKTIPKNGVVFHKDQIGGYTIYACLGTTRVNVGRLAFMPVKCSDHNKNPGDEWTTVGKTEQSICGGVCYAGSNESKERAINWTWSCDNYGHIIPSRPGGNTSMAKGQMVKSVLVDSQIFYQQTSKGKYVGESCKQATREIISEIRCDLNNKAPLNCPSNFPIAMTMEERDELDDMMFGVPVDTCVQQTLYKTPNSTISNKCGSGGTTYLKCKKHCRTQCQADTSNVVKSSDVNIINYYPNSVRSDTH